MILGAGEGALPELRVVSVSDGSELAHVGRDVSDYPNIDTYQGYRVAATDVDGDGDDEVITGSGSLFDGSVALIWDGDPLGAVDGLSPFGRAANGAVFVG